MTPKQERKNRSAIKGPHLIVGKSEMLYPFAEEACPGHVASAHDGKICRRCGVHIDSLRPISDQLAESADD